MYKPITMNRIDGKCIHRYIIAVNNFATLMNAHAAYARID